MILSYIWMVAIVANFVLSLISGDWYAASAWASAAMALFLQFY